MKTNEDLIDKIYGRLTVKKCLGIKNNQTTWLCECICGSIKEVTTSDLKSYNTTSCGCLARETKKKNGIKGADKLRKDLSNQKFNRWFVTDKFETRGRNRVYWFCRCECGNEKWVLAYNLTHNISQSCGCLHKERASKNAKKINNKTHGLSKTKLYKCYRSMRDRCYLTSNENYHNYGGRGIIVCDEWLQSFENFKNWAFKNGYKEGLSIERINVNGNYEPNNCKWIPMKEQHRNKRTNNLLTYNGQTKTIVEWSEIVGISAGTIHARIYRYGFTVEEALTIPLRGRGK